MKYPNTEIKLRAIEYSYSELHDAVDMAVKGYTVDVESVKKHLDTEYEWLLEILSYTQYDHGLFHKTIKLVKWYGQLYQVLREKLTEH